MHVTTLCYLEKGAQYLMLHRVKKKRDLNQGKWVGVGGKAEPGESPEDCLLREVREETGLTLTRYRLCGIVTFVQRPENGGAAAECAASESVPPGCAASECASPGCAASECASPGCVASGPAFPGENALETEYMFLYTATEWTGTLRGDCREGELSWIDKSAVGNLPIWEGDRVFFGLLEEGRPFFSLKLNYQGDALQSCVLDGERLPL